MPPTLKTTLTFSEKKALDPQQLLRLFQQAPWAKGRTLDEAREMLRHTDLALCAWDGEQLVGFGRVLTDFVYRATIWDVIVDQAYQKQGIGRALLTECESRLTTPRVRLCVRTDNGGAIRLYEQVGYERIDVWRGYYKDKADAIIMEKARNHGGTSQLHGG